MAFSIDSLGDDLRWRHVAAKKIHDHFAGAMAGIGLGRIGGRDAGKPHRRNAEKLADQRHGVGGELAAAGASSGASGALQRVKPRVRHSSAGVLPDRFVNVLNGHGVALELAGSDRAAVKNRAREYSGGPAP